jgi:four helix bundle protein
VRHLGLRPVNGVSCASRRVNSRIGGMMNLDDLKVYQMAMTIGENVWGIVEDWSEFPRNTVGRQFVKAADSIAANISEGYGRYHYKEAKHFSYYARGSLYETKTWLAKSRNRKLVDIDTFQHLNGEIDTLLIKLNNYIKSIGKTNAGNDR